MSMKPTLLNNNNKPRIPRSTSSPSVRQFFQAESSSNLNNINLSPTQGNHVQQVEDRFRSQPSRKLSVLARVKEKARKWKQTLGRKRQGQDSDPTLSWGVAFKDYGRDEVHHNLGTPMYALRHSPGSYRERVLHRSRSGLKITEKHVLSCSIDRGYSEHCERLMLKENPSPTKRLPGLGEETKKLIPVKMTATEQKRQGYYNPPSEIKIMEIEEAEKEKPSSYQKAPILEAREKHLNSQKSIKEGRQKPLTSQEIIIQEAEELNPSSLKLIEEEKGKTPAPSPEEGEFKEEKQKIDSPTQSKALAEAVTEKLAPGCTTISEEAQNMTSEDRGLSLPKILRVTTTRKEIPVIAVDNNDEDCKEYGIAVEHKWDKGVSVKEYIKNKLEPGEDERALSQVITEAISPRRTPGDKGVMEKVKEVVTLLLLAEQKQLESEQEENEKQLLQQQKQQQQQHNANNKNKGQEH